MFKRIAVMNEGKTEADKLFVKVSYIEIHNENIFDLLQFTEESKDEKKPEKKGLQSNGREGGKEEMRKGEIYKGN